MTATMAAVPIADTDTERRLIESASDVTRLADERRDTELRVPVDDLHADLIAPASTPRRRSNPDHDHRTLREKLGLEGPPPPPRPSSQTEHQPLQGASRRSL
jgi:hypothetical protein